jgi:hypothetical protein
MSTLHRSCLLTWARGGGNAERHGQGLDHPQASPPVTGHPDTGLPVSNAFDHRVHTPCGDAGSARAGRERRESAAHAHAWCARPRWQSPCPCTAPMPGHMCALPPCMRCPHTPLSLANPGALRVERWQKHAPWWWRIRWAVVTRAIPKYASRATPGGMRVQDATWPSGLIATQPHSRICPLGCPPPRPAPPTSLTPTK